MPNRSFWQPVWHVSRDRRKQWIWAGFWTAIALGTRPFGVVLLVILLVELVGAWRHGTLHGPTRWRAFLGLLIAPSTMLIFMLHLWWQVGDPFAFVHAQREVWQRTPLFHLRRYGVG